MSGRTAVIALVLSVLALSYAYPVRTYMEQRAEINELRDAQGDQRDRIADLESERAKWDDPEYVRAQARERLLLVEPGEELIIIIDDPEGAAADAGEKPPKEPADPWYDDLRDSFEEADQIGHK
jgi:cell division protein FtsB